MSEKKQSGFYIFSVFAFVMMCWALYMIFIYVPTEKSMGIIQRIFYFHVSLGLNTLMAFTIVFIYSILYLVKKEDKYDIIAYAAAEVGVVFCTLVLITGPIWAKPIWGTWWTWDSRLTTTLILWFIFIAYLMLRATAPSRAQRARFAAVYGIVGFIDVPIVYLSVHWWRTIHPVVIKATGIALAPEMKNTLYVAMAAITCVFFILLRLRVRVGYLREEVDWAKHHLSDLEES
jgi:heme exporter protein C